MSASPSTCVVIVADRLTGGLGHAVALEAQALSSLGVNVVVAHPGAPSSVQYNGEGAEWIVAIPDSARQLWSIWSASRELRHDLRQLRGRSVTHAHGLRSYLVAFLAKPFGRRSVTMHVAEPTHRLKRLIVAALGSTAGLAMTVAPTTLRNWTHVWHFSPKLVGSPHPPRIESGQLRIGWYGRLDYPKRPDTWAQVAAQVAELDAGIRLVVAGEGPLKSELERTLGEYGVSADFLEAATDTADVFRAMDVLLCWSDSEGVPFVLQEATWHGVPCLINHLPGPAAYFGDTPGCISLDAVVPTLLSLRSATARARLCALQQARLLRLLRESQLHQQIHQWVLLS